ncbi:MAG TPA: thrombospondin type 3 repeat-containing protein [Kiritimatiellia bacterium]|nr:thrombospondin type 3 repeat-containing protein [Kiritimatiellia bacterium]
MTFVLLLTIGWSSAQLSDESNSVDSFQDIFAHYLDFRDRSYLLAVPNWYMFGNEIESIESTYGLSGFQNQPDWYVDFNAGDLYFSAKSEIAKQIPHGTKLVVFEDMLTGELLVMRDTGNDFEEEIVFKSLEWPDYNNGESTYQYLYRELSKRRVAWHFTLKEINQAEEEYAAMLAAMEDNEDEGGGMMMLMGGESDSNIVFTAIYRTNGVAVTIAYPEDFTNRLDIFTCNDLLSYIWSFSVRELPTTGTNQITWTDTNAWIQTGLPVRFYAAGNADLDTDGDGYADAREIMVYKTDPNDPDSRPVRVSGTISYSGTETGTIFMLTVTDSNSWSIAKSITLPTPGAYTNSEVGNHQSYWFKAFRDVNGNSTRDSWEPWGMYSGSSTLVTGDISGINITLTDVPSVFGNIAYSGSSTGNLHVLVTSSLGDWTSTHEVVIPWEQGSTNEFGDPLFLSFPTGYMIAGMPASNYWIRAFMDSNYDGTYNLGEPAGQYVTNALSISNRMMGINFAIAVDGDGDGLPDGWEIIHGLSPTNPADAGEDHDQDGLSNLQEYLFGTDLHNPDTDQDGISDGDEIRTGLDPLSNPLPNQIASLAFGYDAQNRLTSVTSTVAAVSMTYDNASNLSSQSFIQGE